MKTKGELSSCEQNEAKKRHLFDSDECRAVMIALPLAVEQSFFASFCSQKEDSSSLESHRC